MTIKPTRNSLSIKAVDEQLCTPFLCSAMRNCCSTARGSETPSHERHARAFHVVLACSATHVPALWLRRCVALTGTMRPSSQCGQLGGLIPKAEPGRRGTDLCSVSRRSPAPVPAEEVVAGSEQPTLPAGRFKKKKTI